MSFNERIHGFGKGETTIGIVSLPEGDDGARSSKLPFVVLLSAGLVHRVGPFGMNVQIARDLARRGFRVLRFDQSGIGDSPAGTGGTIEERGIADGRVAFDFLAERYGATQFIVGGLCSGAMNAHRVGVADERAVGVCLLDGYAYPTLTYQRARLVRRLKEPSTWIPTAARIAGRVAKRAQEKLRGVTGGGAGGSGETEDGKDARTALFYQDWPEVSSVRADLEQMLARGTRLLFVYTGGWSSFVAPHQFDEMFPGLPARDRVTVRYHALADHTYMALEDREKLLTDVAEFIGGFA